MLRHEFERLAKDSILDALNLDWLKSDQITRFLDVLWEKIGKRWSDEQICGVFEIFQSESSLRITRGINFTAAILNALHEAYAVWLDRNPTKQAPQFRDQQARGACPNQCERGWLHAYRDDDKHQRCGVVAPCAHCMPFVLGRKSRTQLENAGYRVVRPGESPLRVQAEVFGQPKCMEEVGEMLRYAERMRQELVTSVAAPKGKQLVGPCMYCGESAPTDGHGRYAHEACEQVARQDAITAEYGEW